MALWMRRNALRVAFAASASWAAVGLFMEELFAWIPDGAGRSAIEFAVVGSVVLVCGAITWAIVRRRPEFLRVREGLPFAFWLSRLLVLVPLSAAIIALVGGVASYVELRLTGDPAHSQYGVSVAWAVVWYPVFLTPIVAVVALWRAALR